RSGLPGRASSALRSARLFVPELDDAGRLIEQDFDRRAQLVGAERLAEDDRPAEPGRQSVPSVSGNECERTVFPCAQGRKVVDRLACEIDVEQGRVAV